MTAISPQAVSVGDGEITIEANVLAFKLGLSVEALKENMVRGLVTGVTETGIDEDEGSTRLTFRYKDRVWRVVIIADGTLLEDPVPASQAKPKSNDHFSLVQMVRDTSRQPV